jgi:hypothetical protein
MPLLVNWAIQTSAPQAPSRVVRAYPVGSIERGLR